MYVQSRAIGVSPDRTVASVTSVGMKLPDSFRSAKNWMPGMMSSKLPPLASDAAITAAKAAPASRGSPLSATWPLYSGFFRSAKVFGGFFTRVVLVPRAMIP